MYSNFAPTAPKEVGLKPSVDAWTVEKKPVGNVTVVVVNPLAPPVKLAPDNHRSFMPPRFM